jgi:Ca2+-binding RTX toxin-like protein
MPAGFDRNNMTGDCLVITTELLESRVLYSVTADSFHHTLYVWGDSKPNGISVDKDGSDLVAKRYTAGKYVEFYRVPDADVNYVRVYGYAGGDTISISDAVTDEVTVYGGADADWIKGGGGVSRLYGHGNFAGDPDHSAESDDSADDTLVSGKGYALLYGQGGNDSLYTDTNATSAADVMYGGEGADKFYVQGQGDMAYVFGEGGNDTLFPTQSATQKAVFAGGAGTGDKVDYSSWTAAVYVRPDGSNTYSGLRFGTQRQLIESDVEVVIGTNLADYFVGGDTDNTFYGKGGDDVMFGNGGCDTLFGEGGKDELHGGNAHDKLYGGDQSDWLYGDAGNDTLVGGQGSDYLHANDGVWGNDLIYGDNADGSGSADFDVAFIDLGDLLVGVEAYSF